MIQTSDTTRKTQNRISVMFRHESGQESKLTNKSLVSWTELWCYIILPWNVKNGHNLRGHLGVPDTVSEPLIVPLNYLVILHLIHLKAYILWNADSKHLTSEIECFLRYWNSASRTPRYPLKWTSFMCNLVLNPEQGDFHTTLIRWCYTVGWAISSESVAYSHNCSYLFISASFWSSLDVFFPPWVHIWMNLAQHHVKYSLNSDGKHMVGPVVRIEILIFSVISFLLAN